MDIHPSTEEKKEWSRSLAWQQLLKAGKWKWFTAGKQPGLGKGMRQIISSLNHCTPAWDSTCYICKENGLCVMSRRRIGAFRIEKRRRRQDSDKIGGGKSTVGPSSQKKSETNYWMSLLWASLRSFSFRIHLERGEKQLLTGLFRVKWSCCLSISINKDLNTISHVGTKYDVSKDNWSGQFRHGMSWHTLTKHV